MKGFPMQDTSALKQLTDDKTKKKSPKKPVDPDAPGTPGTPGYEPLVRREDLDEMGKKIWDCNNNPKTRWNNKTKKCEPIKNN